MAENDIALLYGVLAGLGLPAYYENTFTDEEKTEWKSKFPMHHGESGVILGVAGIAMLFSQNKKVNVLGKCLFGLGAGLVADDWEDRYEWFCK